MSASQNMLIECQKIGMQTDASPAKLKTGCGEEVCQLLLKLTQTTLQKKFKFRIAKIASDGGGMDDDADDVDEMDGGADFADVIHEADSEDDMIEDEFDNGAGNMQAEMAKQMEAEMQQNAIIQSNVSKEKWQIEVEKVAHRLKINPNLTDGKEWRSHLDQTKKYAENVRNSLPEVRYKLERLQDDASKAIDKIARKEGVLTRSF